MQGLSGETPLMSIGVDREFIIFYVFGFNL